MILTLVCAVPARAQKVTTVEDLTFEQTLVQLANPLGLRPIGESIALTTALEIATQPLANPSGGMVFKLDPATGLLARVSTTFGPSFGERALTAGEGKIGIAATFSATSYDKLSKFGLNNLPLGSVTASNVIVPLITATIEATTTQVDGNGRFIRLAETNSQFSGIGDMAAVFKVKAA
jgi:hypothetical protein